MNNTIGRSCLAKCLCLALCLLCLAAWAVAEVEISETSFPDAHFREFIQKAFDADGSGSLTDAELAGAWEIDVIDEEEIHDVRGVEFFTELGILNCSGCDLEQLDVSRNTKLFELFCSWNWDLTQLDVSHNPELVELNCGRCALKALDVSMLTKLEQLNCNWNHEIAALNVANSPRLVKLQCAQSGLTALDLSQNPEIHELECFGNALTALDVRHMSKLNYLNCRENEGLAALDVTQNAALIELDCGETAIAALDVSGSPNLQALNCENTNLTSLDLSKNTKLVDVACGGAKIAALNVTGSAKLEALDCHSCALTSLDLSKNPRLQTLNCGGNAIATLDISGNPYLLAAYFTGESETEGGIVTYTKAVDGGTGDDPVEYRLTVSESTTVVANAGDGTVAIDAANFPDATFRAYVKGNLDMNGDGALSETERASCQVINVKGRSIADLKGVEHFENLYILNCSENALTALDVSNNHRLEWLDCSDNRLQTLTLGVIPELNMFYCTGNQLTELDLRDCPYQIVKLCDDVLEPGSEEGLEGACEYDPGVKLTGITRPMGVAVIGDPEIKGSVDRVEDEALMGTGVELVDTPASVIGSKAFANCPNLKIVILYGAGHKTIADDAFDGHGEHFYIGVGGHNDEIVNWAEARGFTTFELPY